MQLSSYNYTKPKELRLTVDKFDGGTNTIQSDTRLKPTEATESLNLMLVDDGLWRPRWGTRVYGGEISGANSVDGFGEFVKTDGTRELIAVGAGKVWKKNDNTWDEITGATFTAGTACEMRQINNFLYIVNGTDAMARYNGTSLSTYTGLDAPENVTPSRGAGLSSGNYTYYVQVTALNAVGESGPSTEASIAIDIERDNWDETAGDEHIDISWDAVAGATRYQIYISDESGYEKYVSVSETNSWRDEGTSVINPYVSVPDDDTTEGPLISTLELAGNRIWGTRDTTNKYRVYWTGAGAEIGNFSAFYGGGWIDLEKGGRTEPQVVVDYRNGQGEQRATVICSTPEGTGNVWQIALVSTEVEGTSFTIPSATKIVGSVGTNATRSVVLFQNDIAFSNKRGIFALGNERQYWGILRTNELSVSVRPTIDNIHPDMTDDVCAYYFDDKVWFSVSTNGTENNRIFYYDREHRAWVSDWSTGVRQFGQYTDANGVTKFLGASSTDGYLVEIGEGIIGDRGVAFTTRYRSPRFSATDDWTLFMKLKKFTIRVENPRGTIKVNIYGTGRRKSFSALESATLTTASALTGVGYDLIGTMLVGDTEGAPTTYSAKNTQRHIKLTDKVRDYQIVIETTVLDNDYKLLGYTMKGKLLRLSEPSSEKL